MRHFLFLLLASSMAAGAADLPPLVMPAGVGLNIHFRHGREADLDKIAAAGFKVVREDFIWQYTELKKGEYDFSAYDELTSNLEKRGLRPLYILAYSNPLYEQNGAAPQHPESVEAFARWAGAAAKRYSGRRVIWEIWNEPNFGFWKPAPDVHQYTALALAVIKAVRLADPNATIIGPGTSQIPLDYLEEFFKSGVLSDLDAVSVHPYRPQAPETVTGGYQALRALIARYAPPGKQVPIICSEWGYNTSTRAGVSAEVQASYLVRQQLWNLSQGIPLTIWYDWQNDGPKPDEPEHNFGITTQDSKPKPALDAVRAMTAQLNGYHFVRRLHADSPGDYLLLFANSANAKMLAAWTAGDPHAIEADTVAGEIPLTKQPKFIPAPGAF